MSPVLKPRKGRPATNAYLSIQSHCTQFDLTTPLASIYVDTSEQEVIEKPNLYQDEI